MAIGDRIRKRRAGRKASKTAAATASSKGDSNSLIGRGLSNKFNQQVGDGLKDLLSGAIGVRTSNIPEIDQKLKDARELGRKARSAAMESPARSLASNMPQTSRVLVFPDAYFNEKGESISVESEAGPGSSSRKLTAEEVNKLERKEEKVAVGTAPGGFPNSIHFRSLPRPKMDTSEGIWTKGRMNRNNEKTMEGVVDPINEEVFDIFLYLPHNLGDAIKVSWEAAEGGIVDTFFANLFTGGEHDAAVDDLTGNRGFDMGEVMRMFQGMLPGGAIIQRAAGALANPMKFQSFTGLDFRTYSYKFTLKPSSAAEAKTIREIVHAFKLSSLPGTAGNNDRIWTMPNEWLIKFQGPIKEWIDFPLTVVCESVDINYSAGGAYTLMEDGSPQAMELTVGFKETTQLSRQKYKNMVSAHNHATRKPADSGTKLITDPIGGGDQAETEEQSISTEFGSVLGRAGTEDRPIEMKPWDGVVRDAQGNPVRTWSQNFWRLLSRGGAN